MNTTTPAAVSAPLLPPVLAAKARPRASINLKLLLIAGLILVLQIPLSYINSLRQDRAANWKTHLSPVARDAGDTIRFDAYRIVDRSLKYGMLIMTLVFTAFFLFEILGGLQFHVVHYALTGMALCLFYLALLALGEVVHPSIAYAGAALASSALIVLYSVAILRSGRRALAIAALLATVYGVLYIILVMEQYALLAGTATLFAALGAVMYFTRDVDWTFAESPERARN